MAPATGFEPVALRLTAECSTAELRRNTLANYTYSPLFRQPLAAIAVAAKATLAAKDAAFVAAEEQPDTNN
jgi:hypothetical protein